MVNFYRNLNGLVHGDLRERHRREERRDVRLCQVRLPPVPRRERRLLAHLNARRVQPLMALEPHAKMKLRTLPRSLVSARIPKREVDSRQLSSDQYSRTNMPTQCNKGSHPAILKLRHGVLASVCHRGDVQRICRARTSHPIITNNWESHIFCVLEHS